MLLFQLLFSYGFYNLLQIDIKWKNTGEFDAAGEAQWLSESPDCCPSVTVSTDTFL